METVRYPGILFLGQKPENDEVCSRGVTDLDGGIWSWATHGSTERQKQDKLRIQALRSRLNMLASIWGSKG